MRLAVETWLTPEHEGTAQELGVSRLTLGDSAYLSLEKIESRLRDGESREAVLNVKPSRLKVETPPECGPLSECRLRVYLREHDDTGHVQVIGRRASDGEQVQTTAVMLRTIAL